MAPQAKEFTVGPGVFGFLCGLARVEEFPSKVVIPILTELGLSHAGARTYLARMVRSEQLRSIRTGREVCYRMYGMYLHEFRTLATKQQAPHSPQWNGHFHLATYAISEKWRASRDGLLRAATADGFRQLRPGVLIGAHPPAEWADSRVLVGTWSVDEDTARTAIATAWDLEESAEMIRDLVAQRNDKAGKESIDDLQLIAQTTRRHNQLFVALRHQPPFPARLLPQDYPSEDLVKLLQEDFGRDLPTAGAAIHRLLKQHADGKL